MTNDIIERAKAGLRSRPPSPLLFWETIVNQLITALEDAREENKQLRDQQYGFGSMYSAGSDV